jgi:hypothetical protein
LRRADAYPQHEQRRRRRQRHALQFAESLTIPETLLATANEVIE